MSYNWSKKTVVVSGGSKGFGAQIAFRAAKQNARLILLGRDATALEQTRERALRMGADSVEVISVDASQIQDSIEYKDAVDRSGVDLLVNAIGRSDRGTLEQLTMNELSQMFHDNVLLGWNVTKTTLEALGKTQGVVANISSLAGIIATPNLGAYCPSKFAWTAISRQWRLELEPRGIHVMLVCPGPIARDDSDQRYDQLIGQRGGLSEQVKGPGGGAKLKLLDPVWLGDKILMEAARRTPEIIVPAKARILAALMPFFPGWADRLLRNNMGK